jgi:hypothetical protein
VPYDLVLGKSPTSSKRPNEHNFGALLMLAVTAGAFLMVTWVATKGLFFFF